MGFSLQRGNISLAMLTQVSPCPTETEDMKMRFALWLGSALFMYCIKLMNIILMHPPAANELVMLLVYIEFGGLKID
jgi:hypothetical protein